MTILWITEHYYPNQGGMARSCDRIVSGLRALNIAVDVIHLARKCRRPTRGSQASGRDCVWPLGDNPSHGLNLLWNWLEKEHAQQKYSKIVAFGTHYALTGARNFAAWLDTPLVTMVRGNDFDSGIFDLRRRHLIEDIYRASEQVICVSQDKVKKIKALYPEVNAHCIANGIDLSQWCSDENYQAQAHTLRRQLLQNHSNPEAVKVIGLIGDLKNKKGGEFLLKTLSLSGLTDSLHIHLVGNLDEELQLFLEENQERIHFTHIPFVSWIELIPQYLACDCIAIPSFYDGMPNVLLEACGLACTVLAANTGGMQDVLSHADNALLFEPGDEHELRAMLEYVAFAPTEHLQELGKAAKTLVANHYTQEQEALAYAKALSDTDVLTSNIATNSADTVIQAIK